MSVNLEAIRPFLHHFYQTSVRYSQQSIAAAGRSFRKHQYDLKEASIKVLLFFTFIYFYNAWCQERAKKAKSQAKDEVKVMEVKEEVVKIGEDSKDAVASKLDLAELGTREVESVNNKNTELPLDNENSNRVENSGKDDNEVASEKDSGLDDSIEKSLEASVRTGSDVGNREPDDEKITNMVCRDLLMQDGLDGKKKDVKGQATNNSLREEKANDKCDEKVFEVTVDVKQAIDSVNTRVVKKLSRLRWS